MPYTVDKKFVFDGTSLTRSYADRQRGRAQVVVFLSGGNDDTEGKSEAITAAVSDVGDPYPHEGDELPLAMATAKVWANGKAQVTLSYGRTQGDPPIVNAFDFARESAFGSRRKQQWHIWDSGEGTFSAPPINEWFELDASEGEFLLGITDDLPLSIITVPCVLTTNPISADVLALYGHTNSDSVVINGVDRDPGTLKFMGVRYQPTDKRSGVVNAGDLQFQWFPAGWANQMLQIRQKPVDTGGTLPSYVNEYYVSNLPIRLFSPFANKFTVHDGTGPALAS